jgi:hypothetical protein
MDSYKIDILKTNDVLITQNLNTQEQKYFTISELSGELLKSYSNFDTLVDDKIIDDYTQIYVAKEPVIRFVVMAVNYITTSNYQEVLYGDLNKEEKLTFDTFYSLFTK